MNDHDVDLVLRDWYRKEVDGATASPTLQRRVSQITVSVQRRHSPDNRRLLMVAAALVTSTIVLSLIASFGGNLIRLPVALVPSPTPPTPTTAPNPSVGPTFPAGGTLTAMEEPLPGSCGQRLPDGLALRLVVEPPPVNGLDSDPQMVLVTNDGLVLSGRRGQVRLGEGIRARQLTPDGLDSVERLIRDATLANCQRVTIDATYRSISLTVGLGAVELAVEGRSDRFRAYRPSSGGEIAALTLMVERLLDLPSWIEAAGWADTDWSQFMPDRWRLMVTPDFESAGCRTGIALSPPDLTDCQPWAYLVMPDGTPLLAFGDYYPFRAGFSPAYRCAVIDELAAAEVVDVLHLGEADARGAYNGYWDTNGMSVGTNTGTIMLKLIGLLPGDQGCQPVSSDPGDPGSPPPDLAPPIDPCRLLRGSVNPTRINGFVGQSEPSGPGWWAACVVEPSGASFGAFVRGRQTSAADGVSYATSLFGTDVEVEQLNGRMVIWNNCFDPVAGCSAAAALISPPHLIVFYSYADDARAELHALIEQALEKGLIP